MDVDAGIDDALAIMLALRSPEVELHAITAVSGNVHVDKTSLNALRALEASGVSGIPVAKGMGKPLERDLETAEYFHGDDGLGNSNLPSPKLQLDGRQAVSLLLEETAAHPKEITIVATGPLTNIASSILRDARFARNVRELVLMGGAYGITPYGCGNITPVSEFNVYVDPEAASIVFKSGIPITAVGLDVTMDPKATLTRELYRQIGQSTARTRFVTTITQELMRKYGFIHLHDPIAVALTVDPSLVTTREYHVDVETSGRLTRGETIADRRTELQKPESPLNANVCVSIEGERFLMLFMERVGRA